MTDTPSAILLLRLQSTGSNTNLWGGYVNTAMQTIEQASKGYQTLNVTGDATISWTNYSTGNTGQCAHLKLTGALVASATLTFPSLQNWMSVYNATGQTVTIKCSGGTGVAIPNLRRALIRCDATDYSIDSPTWTAESLTLTNSGDFVTNGQIASVLAALSGTTINGLVLNSAADTTADYLANKLSIQVTGATTTQLSGLLSLQWSTLNGGAKEQRALVHNSPYVGGFLPAATQVAQFTPVVGTSYDVDCTSAGVTINLSGMTTPQVGQRIRLNCFGTNSPFLLGTVNSATNLTPAPGYVGEIVYSGSSWGWNMPTGGVKSIQSGTIAMSTAQTTNTATITSVNTAKAVIVWAGSTANGDVASSPWTYLVLTNATTLTVNRNNTGSGSISTTTAYQVLEYY